MYGAGIGGGFNIACGNIVINGGAITASGGLSAADIGGGYNSSCGTITINGGTISATGGRGAPGIGSGAGVTGSTAGSSCGNITITSSVTSVKAIKGESATYSIGAGKNRSTCGTINIGGTTYDNGITDSTYNYPPIN